MAINGISMDAMLAKLQAAREAASHLPAQSADTKATQATDFAALLKAGISAVDKSQAGAVKMAEQFQLGDPKVGLEDAMVALQKANVSFQAAVQVRNRLVAAYHEVMNLQI